MNLEELAPKITGFWNKVAKALGFKDKDIRNFRTVSDDNRKDRAFAMLSEWYQNILAEAKEKLVQAFEGVRRRDLGNTVRRSGVFR